MTKSVKLIIFSLLLTVILAFKKSPGKNFKRGFKKQALLVFRKHWKSHCHHQKRLPLAKISPPLVWHTLVADLLLHTGWRGVLRRPREHCCWKDWKASHITKLESTWRDPVHTCIYLKSCCPYCVQMHCELAEHYKNRSCAQVIQSFAPSLYALHRSSQIQAWKLWKALGLACQAPSPSTDRKQNSTSFFC